jgi:hypothetical protein
MEIGKDERENKKGGLRHGHFLLIRWEQFSL